MLDVAVISSLSGVEQNVAESLTLTCQAEGGTGIYSYQWSSDCTGDCFVTSQDTQTIAQDALHSTDSGNHTCTVTDSAGNAGSVTIQIQTGGTSARIYSEIQLKVTVFCGVHHTMQV